MARTYVISAQGKVCRNFHLSKSFIVSSTVTTNSTNGDKVWSTQLHAFSRLICLTRSFLRGVPAVVDFAAMRDAVKRLGGDPEKINPVCPADLVIDHSIQVDFNRRWERWMSTWVFGFVQDCGVHVRVCGCVCVSVSVVCVSIVCVWLNKRRKSLKRYSGKRKLIDFPVKILGAGRKI